MFHKKPLCYLSSPYSLGNQGYNLRFHMDTWHALFGEGYVTPIAPLWSHFQDMIHPMDGELWMDFDFELIRHCDALIRLDARNEAQGYVQRESKGCDREVEFARSLGIPTFMHIDQLHAWAKQWTPPETPNSNAS